MAGHVQCRWCGEIIHHPPEKLVSADLSAEGWVHTNLRPHCRDAAHRAEPAPAEGDDRASSGP